MHNPPSHEDPKEEVISDGTSRIQMWNLRDNRPNDWRLLFVMGGWSNIAEKSRMVRKLQVRWVVVVLGRCHRAFGSR